MINWSIINYLALYKLYISNMANKTYLLSLELEFPFLRIQVSPRHTCEHIIAVTPDAQDELDRLGCPICKKEKKIKARVAKKVKK